MYEAGPSLWCDGVVWSRPRILIACKLSQDMKIPVFDVGIGEVHKKEPMTVTSMTNSIGGCRISCLSIDRMSRKLPS